MIRTPSVAAQNGRVRPLTWEGLEEVGEPPAKERAGALTPRRRLWQLPPHERLSQSSGLSRSTPPIE